MVAALSVPAFAYELKSFSDVAEDHWAYKAIMRSVELGLIAGTKAPDANGVGEFNPNANMTRAQFIVVTMRAVAPDVLNELNNAGQGETWYEKGVFFSYENGTTGIKNLDFTGFIETEPIIIPPFDKVQEFDDYCNSIFSQVFANGKQSEQLASLRDTLLPKLMSGELDVSDIEL